MSVPTAVERILATGAEPTYSLLETVGLDFANEGREFLHVRNDSISVAVVTIATPATAAGLTIEDQIVSVPVGEHWMIGKFPKNVYNDADGRVTVVSDQAADVTCAILTF